MSVYTCVIGASTCIDHQSITVDLTHTLVNIYVYASSMMMFAFSLVLSLVCAFICLVYLICLRSFIAALFAHWSRFSISFIPLLERFFVELCARDVQSSDLRATSPQSSAKLRPHPAPAERALLRRGRGPDGGGEWRREGRKRGERRRDGRGAGVNARQAEEDQEVCPYHR